MMMHVNADAAACLRRCRVDTIAAVPAAASPPATNVRRPGKKSVGMVAASKQHGQPRRNQRDVERSDMLPPGAMGLKFLR